MRAIISGVNDEWKYQRDKYSNAPYETKALTRGEKISFRSEHDSPNCRRTQSADTRQPE